MSAKATFWAWDQDLKGSAKLTLLALANCENSKTKRCNPSIEYLSKMTGLNRKTVINALANLEKLGLISQQKKYGASNNFKINWTQTSTSLGTGSPSKPVPNSVLVQKNRPVPISDTTSTNLGQNQYQFRDTNLGEPKTNLGGGGINPPFPPPHKKFLMNNDWQPDQTFDDLCNSANINVKKIHQERSAKILAEFIAFWMDTKTKETHHDWQHKFFKNLLFESKKGDLYANQIDNSNQSIRSKTIEEKLSDRSWAIVRGGAND